MAKRNPFNDESDSNEQSANERAAAKVRERATASRDEPERIELDSHDDDEREPERETPQEKEARKERRANRYREQKEGREAAEREAAQLRAENERLRTQGVVVETMRQMMPQPQRPAVPDPIDHEIEVTRQSLQNVQMEFRRIHAERTAAGNPMSQTEIDDWNKKAQELDDKVVDLRVAKASRQRAPQGPPQNQREVAMEAYLHMQFPDVMGDQAMKQYAFVEAQAILRKEGKQYADLDVVTRAIQAARERFGIAPARKPSNGRPSAGLQAKFGGVAAGSTRGSDSGGGRVVEMTTDDKRMARAMYPTLSEPDAYKRWAQKIGAKRLEEE